MFHCHFFRSPCWIITDWVFNTKWKTVSLSVSFSFVFIFVVVAQEKEMELETLREKNRRDTEGLNKKLQV